MNSARPLWQILLTGEKQTLSCRECSAILTYLAELGAAGVDEPVLWELIKRHLAKCPDCEAFYRRQIEKLEALYLGKSN